MDTSIVSYTLGSVLVGKQPLLLVFEVEESNWLYIHLNPETIELSISHLKSFPRHFHNLVTVAIPENSEADAIVFTTNRAFKPFSTGKIGATTVLWVLLVQHKLTQEELDVHRTGEAIANMLNVDIASGRLV
jgi:hypothetical protein